jgi:hypothetical protein
MIEKAIEMYTCFAVVGIVIMRMSDPESDFADQCPQISKWILLRRCSESYPPQMRRLGGLLLEGGANVFLNGRGGRSIFVHEGRRSCWSSADTWHHIFEYERKRVEHSSTRLLECGGLVGGVKVCPAATSLDASYS